MVREYKRKLGARSYKNYSDETLAKAVAEVRAGLLTQSAAAKKYKINRTTILNKIHHQHELKPGHPTVLTPETEKLIADTLKILTDWGVPFTKRDIQIIVQMLVTREGRVIKQWKDNSPGPDFVTDFAARNNLTQRLATNIKPARASVGPNEIKEFFENVRPALEETRPGLIYNYDETNVTDDPGAIKVLVPRGHRRVERVQEHSKSSVSIMFCGTADGKMIPPMVVYKSKHLYENWTMGGPLGTIYRNSHSGWFDMNLFEVWFFKLLLPSIQEERIGNEKAVVIGDNLASHFSPEVVQAAIQNNIHFTTLTPNSTHIMQPLDVGIYGPLKRQWRKILDTWRKESRIRGIIPKPQFPMLLKRLMDAMAPNLMKNLQSSFRTTGFYPFDPQVVLQKLPGEREQETGRILDSCLLEFLKETRGYNTERIRHRRGRKVVNKPGAQILVTSQRDNAEEDAPEIDVPPTIDDIPEIDSPPMPEVSSPSTFNNSPKSISILDFPTMDDSPEIEENVSAFENNQPSTSGLLTKNQTDSDEDVPLSCLVRKKEIKNRKKDKKKNKKESNLCYICRCDYRFYRHSVDWICCITCKNWVCGMCNKGSNNPSYECVVCEDDSD
ncbi:uncharacterized protein LOC123876139 [Maniola jurtina]|uniref:uncharacterized protein LOC123864636 n=1 Tax=Maniola jurtina TaxID=191418 RepID=UPI001E68E9A7|nr:uncharacterized protein LOC123864636 [Maniola jurtina]XP_045761297.1 uncharacterized protein LOC123864719 [Maniola jurtina]XP_045765976.1 uncharacterized protein LOC123867771 [Maniola jurtina]XP_045778247.1 uncharacterized protein LOC123876139 [Maniola jurtina]